ncbi:unnamed protein product [Allacma fusca]|uniref:Uncharacterized protein n=1 Tax=Allacma fusca TaxID=39272 RepID=A0A8J2LAL0_9HEXA|nr:unnamed protein product [Allacma fusca]
MIIFMSFLGIIKIETYYDFSKLSSDCICYRIVRMPEREIICCGPSGWTKAIAWIQIVMNSFTTCALLMYTYALIDTVGTNGGDIVLEDFSYHSNYVTTLTSAQFFSLVVFAVLVSVVGLVMGVVLLQGAKQQNVKYLTAWIHFAAFLMVCNLVSIVLRDSSIDEIIYRLGFTASLYGFGIMVVRMHVHDIQRRREFEDEKPPEYSQIMSV